MLTNTKSLLFLDKFLSFLLLFFLPDFVAGEKKLKTGEKMVPSRVVRGGLLAASTGVSSLPFGLMGLLLQVIVTKKKKRQLFNKLKTKYLSKFTFCFTTLLVCSTFIRTFPANSGDRFVGKASCLWG